jgi:hypothetical protein
MRAQVLGAMLVDSASSRLRERLGSSYTGLQPKAVLPALRQVEDFPLI